MTKKIKILDSKTVEKKIVRLSWELYENNLDQSELIIIGIAKRGIILAKEIAFHLEKISNINTIVGSLELNKDFPYKDDVKINISTSDYINKVVILVDDVLSSGKTLIYGARYFLDTPINKLSTVVLIDRNHNTFPIKADYIGVSLSTTLKEYITVNLVGKDKGVYLS